jgi:hypothetical protein
MIFLVWLSSHGRNVLCLMALVWMGKSNWQIDLNPFLIVWRDFESFTTPKNIEPIVFY